MSGYLHGRDLGGFDFECDVVVVGSGAAGAVVACHLAEAGQDVIVLEEGGHIEAEELARMRPSQVIRHAWRDGGTTLAYGLASSPMINVMMGRCVGGSSVMTGGVCFRIPEPVLADWRALGLGQMTAEGLEPFYADVERSVQVGEVPRHLWSPSTVLFDEGARKLGHALSPMRRNTSGCIGWSTCNFGCPENAKLSVNVSYLPRAVRASARIVSDCLVERVELDGARAAGVSGRVLDRRDGSAGSCFRVRARRVVLAAGALHTPLLLMRSGIARASKQVGRNLTLHPAFRVMARFEQRVEGWRGALQSAYSMHFESEGIQLNSVFVPSGVLAAGMPGIGDRHHRRARAVAHLAIFGANLHDDPGGVVRRGFGREPLVTYRMSARDRARVPRALRICAETFFAAGAREVFLPVLGLDGVDADAFSRLDLEALSPARLECTSQHPLGTCRMGTDRMRAVVDPNGAVFDVRELYIADGSIVPTSLGVNPQLAIMTLATRIAKSLPPLPGERAAAVAAT